MVETRDPLFKPENTTMWQENLALSSTTGTNAHLVDTTDSKIASLQLSQNKMAFDADALSLARDAALLASVYKQQMKNDRAHRLAKVMHIKQQNQLGSSLVLQHLEVNAKHISGPIATLTAEVDKVGWFGLPN